MSIKNYKIAEKEVGIAYCEETRNLDFEASVAVSRDEAYKIMKKHVPSYNEFEPSMINKLPDGCQIVLARQGSVCMYVKTDEHISSTFADEVDNDNGTWRLWWD